MNKIVACFESAQGTAEIAKLLQQRIDVDNKGVGIVVGVISDKGRAVIGHGKLDLEREKRPDGDTVFEIGSVTKVFTASLLSCLVERGELDLDVPISRYLPEHVKVPTRNGREITLLHLATHTSALPRLPANLAPQDWMNPYADYTVEQMYAFLSDCALTRDVGDQFEYSNYGFGLLGHILALRLGTDYETCVRTTICEPLQMHSTGIRLSPDMQARLATGYDQDFKPAKNWDFDALAGCGALRSTADDMLNFLAANLEIAESPFASALQNAHQRRRDADKPDSSIGLGWMVRNMRGTEITWHNGGTLGYYSFVGFDKRQRTGVVILTNWVEGIEDIGVHLLLDTDYDADRDG